jgi:hypothetical protein
MQLLVPAYSAPVAMKALLSPVPLTVVVNPNSGPGLQRLPEWKQVFDKAATSQHTILAYIDLLAIPGDGIIETKKVRLKTPPELIRERDLYRAHYAHSAGYFFDDAETSKSERTAIKNLFRGTRVLNPGFLTAVYPNFRHIIHESEEPLTKEPARIDWPQCGVVLLSCPRERALSEAARLTKGSSQFHPAYFYAHHDADAWENDRTAYDSLPTYWPDLIQAAAAWPQPTTPAA